MEFRIKEPFIATNERRKKGKEEERGREKKREERRTEGVSLLFIFTIWLINSQNRFLFRP